MNGRFACTAIVVSYNSAAELPACLDSLARQSGVDLRVLVVDNASSDDSAAVAGRAGPPVRVIRNSENRGFGRANNQGFESEPGAAFYALVNPDTVLPPTVLAACLEALGDRPRAAIVGPRLVAPDGATQPSCHAFLGLRNLFGETLGVQRIAPGLRSFSSLHMPWFRHDRVAEVDWIQGAFLVVRGDAVRAVGGFDPDFFMYGEEMDWCLRLRRAGWSAVFLPEPAVVHVGGASSAPVAGPMFVENLKGRIRFLRKHRGALVEAAARAIIALSVLLRLALVELRTLGGGIGEGPGGDALRRRRTMFREAARWVLRGLPV